MRPRRHALRARAGRRPEDGQGAGRARGRVRRQPRAVGRPRARPAVGDVGAPPGRHAGTRGDLGRSVRRDRGRGSCPSRPRVPARVRAGAWRDIATWAGISLTEAKLGAGRGSTLRPLPRRGRTRAGRPARRATPRSGDSGAGALPAPLGREPARPRPPRRASCRRPTGRASSAPRTRSRSGRTSSMASWPAPGRCATAGSSSTRSEDSDAARLAASNESARRSRRSTPEPAAAGSHDEAQTRRLPRRWTSHSSTARTTVPGAGSS